MTAGRPIVVLCVHGEAKRHIEYKTYREPPQYNRGGGRIADYHYCPGGRVLEQATIIERDVVQIFGGSEFVPDADEGLGNPYVLAKRISDAELAVLLWREGHRDEDLGVMLMQAAQNYVDFLRLVLRRALASAQEER